MAAILEKDGTVFEFSADIGTQNADGFCKVDICGEVPVPKIRKTDRILLPVDEGIVLKADGNYENGEFRFSKIRHRLSGREGTLSMLVVQRDRKYLMIALQSGVHSVYSVPKENGIYQIHITNEKTCSVYYKVFDQLITLCKAYKALKASIPLTLTQKAAKNPLVSTLFGGAIFWIWNENYDEVMYSDHDTDLEPQTGDSLLKIAEELKNEGIDQAMIGIFFEKDSNYVEQLYRDYGYLATQYDNYNDVLNPALLSIIPNNRVKNCDYTARRMKDYPDGVLLYKDGTMGKAWALKGFDGEMHSQNSLCPLVAKDRMKAEVAQVLEKYPYYKGRFIDVYGTGITECFHPEHPVTLEECVRVKAQAFQNLLDMGLITGTEDGFEAIIDSLVYTEGMHSPVYFRNHNAGRRHANMYNDAEKTYIAKYMLQPEYRVPLFQLVNHENLLTFPYWGDSTDDCPEQIKEKTLFACLFGCPPLYSFSVKDFPKVKESILYSYRRISPIHRLTATEPMTDYRILTEDYAVQQTVFGDKYEVTVNFSDWEFCLNGERILPKDLVFRVL